MNAALAIQAIDLRRVYKLRGPKRKDDAKELVALDGEGTIITVLSDFAISWRSAL
jgi:hypothetical protein